jgi:hypothetical protein
MRRGPGLDVGRCRLAKTIDHCSPRSRQTNFAKNGQSTFYSDGSRVASLAWSLSERGGASHRCGRQRGQATNEKAVPPLKSKSAQQCSSSFVCFVLAGAFKQRGTGRAFHRDIKAIGAAAHLVRSSLNDPWAMSAIPEFIYPDTTGERTPDLQDRLNFRRALGRLAVLGAEVYELLVEIRHVLKPRTLLDDPAIVRRVKEEIAEWRCLVAPLAT